MGDEFRAGHIVCEVVAIASKASDDVGASWQVHCVSEVGVITLSAVTRVFLKGVASLPALFAPGCASMARVVKMTYLETSRAHA